MRSFCSDVLRKNSILATAVCAAAIVGMGASSALAGEVKGPPGTPGVIGSGSQTDTGAPSHASSICAYSGLNDFRAENGQITFIVQSPGQEVRMGSTPPGIPGIACGHATNPEL